MLDSFAYSTLSGEQPISAVEHDLSIVSLHVYRAFSLTCACRYNEGLEPALAELLSICQRPLEAKEGVEPTSLFSRNADVNTLNEDRLKALPDELV